MPEFRRGLPADRRCSPLLATAGRVVVPIAVQQIARPRDLAPKADPTWTSSTWVVVACAVIVVLITAGRGLPDERAAVPHHRDRAGRPACPARSATCTTCRCCTSRRERRGALVSRVTSDVDQLSQFMQWGGVLRPDQLRPAARGHRGDGRLLVAADAASSWSASCRWCSPSAGSPRQAGRGLRRGPRAGRRPARPPSPSPSSAPSTVRAYGVRGAHRGADRRGDRPALPGGQVDAQRVAVGVVRQRRVRRRRSPTPARGRRRCAAWASAGDITVGTLVAFLFLVTLFVAPVQTASEVLNEAQNARRRLPAGARRPRHRARRARTRRRPRRRARAPARRRARRPLRPT